jgi:ribosome-binding protein aMBF1 (putative translation factor)
MATKTQIDGKAFFIVPEREYLQLRKRAGIPAGSVDALEYSRASLGEKLRKAREVAGLTQTKLAKRLDKSQALVSAAERGAEAIGERYVLAVLKACGLPENWRPSKSGTFPSQHPKRRTG